MIIKQIFIECRDNDFWAYYILALKSVFNWYDITPEHWYKESNFEDITIFIENTMNNIIKLNNKNNEKFPWKIKVYYNDEAKVALENYKMQKGGNSECAYMDIETYLLTPGATIENFIFNI